MLLYPTIYSSKRALGVPYMIHICNIFAAADNAIDGALRVMCGCRDAFLKGMSACFISDGF